MSGVRTDRGAGEGAGRRAGHRRCPVKFAFNPADLAFLVPYIILLAVGMLLVLAEAFYKGKDRTALVGLAVVGGLASAIASIVLYRQLEGAPVRLLGGMLIADR